MTESLGVRFHREATRILQDRNEECVQSLYRMARLLLSSYDRNGFLPPPSGMELESFTKKLKPLVEFTIDEYMEQHHDFFYKNIRTKSLNFDSISRDYRSHLSCIRTCYYKPVPDSSFEQD